MVSLKILLVSLVVLVAVFTSAINAAAAEVKPNDKVVQISHVLAYQFGPDFMVSVSLNADRKLTDARVIVSAPELGIRAGHRVDFSKNKKQTVHIEAPIPVEFDPYIQISFNSQEGRRIKYLPVINQ